MKQFAVMLLAVVIAGNSGRAAQWRSDLPGGTYVVDTGKIASVSTHEYISDGAIRVTELTIATISAVTARFYYIEPVVTNERAQQLLDKVQEKAGIVAERLGQDQNQVWQKVVKNYPLTTHAHTVEYRVVSKDHITRLFSSALDSWRNNKDVTIKISTES